MPILQLWLQEAALNSYYQALYRDCSDAMLMLTCKSPISSFYLAEIMVNNLLGCVFRCLCINDHEADLSEHGTHNGLRPINGYSLRYF